LHTMRVEMLHQFASGFRKQHAPERHMRSLRRGANQLHRPYVCQVLFVPRVDGALSVDDLAGVFYSSSSECSRAGLYTYHRR
jgi:hypothetical protein